MKKNVKFGLAALGALAGVGALAIAALNKQKNEEIYREAELKAMQELDNLMGEDPKCAECSCAEDCAALNEDEAAETPAAEEPAEEKPEAPAEEAPAEEAAEEPAEEAAEEPSED